MNNELLLNAIAKHISLTEAERQQLLAVLLYKKVKKKQFLSIVLNTVYQFQEQFCFIEVKVLTS